MVSIATILGCKKNLWLSFCDMTVPSKSNVPSLWPWPLTYEGQFFQWIEYNPISILYKFQIDISSNSWEIKYQNIGRTHTHTDRQTGWKQYLETPSGGEVTRQSEMANTSPATCQCLATFTPLKSKMLIFFSWRHFSARSSCYIINWYGYPRGSHEKYLKEIVSPVFEIRYWIVTC